MPELRLTAEEVDGISNSRMAENHPFIEKLCIDWMNLYHAMEELIQTHDLLALSRA